MNSKQDDEINKNFPGSHNYNSANNLIGSDQNNNRDDFDDRDDSSIALKVDNLSKVYDSPAGRLVVLRKINFIIRKGEFVSIVGPSGSGKSTLLNLIGGLDKPSYGRVVINGIDIFSLKDNEIAQMRNRLIGFIFQSFNLISRTTVQKNVEIPAIIAGMDSKGRHERSSSLLRTLGIEDKALYRPINLSGGQQQRVAIARSLINNPAIILADEPTGNLDTKTGKEVFDLLTVLANKYRRTNVLITYDPGLSERTHRTIFIRDGMIEKEVIN